MINKLLLAGLCLMSTVAYADSITSTSTSQPLTAVLDYTDKVDATHQYVYDVKNKDGTINFSVTASLGQTVPFSTTLNQDEKCKLQIKNSSSSTTLVLGAISERDLQVTILPFKDKDGVVETLIDLNHTKLVNKENPQVINEECSISNTLANTYTVRWLGDLPLNKEKVIKLTNGDELYIKTIYAKDKKSSF